MVVYQREESLMKKKNIILICTSVVMIFGVSSWLTYKQIQYSHAEKYMKSIGINPDSFSKEDVIKFWNDIAFSETLSDSTTDILEKEAGTILDSLTDNSKKTVAQLVESGALDTLLQHKKFPSGEAGKITPHISGDEIDDILNQLEKDDIFSTYGGTVKSIEHSVLTISCPDNNLFQTITLTLTPSCEIVFSDNSKAQLEDIMLNDKLEFTLTKKPTNKDSQSKNIYSGTPSFIKINP